MCLPQNTHAAPWPAPWAAGSAAHSLVVGSLPASQQSHSNQPSTSPLREQGHLSKSTSRAGMQLSGRCIPGVWEALGSISSLEIKKKQRKTNYCFPQPTPCRLTVLPNATPEALPGVRCASPEVFVVDRLLSISAIRWRYQVFSLLLKLTLSPVLLSLKVKSHPAWAMNAAQEMCVNYMILLLPLPETPPPSSSPPSKTQGIKSMHEEPISLLSSWLIPALNWEFWTNIYRPW